MLGSNSETEVSMSDDKSARIRELNDKFRSTHSGGRVLYTQGVSALPDDVVAKIMSRVETFDDFTTDNDPYGEHDFGQVEADGHKVFWKIDLYE
jgi:hypothetical protein